MTQVIVPEKYSLVKPFGVLTFTGYEIQLYRN